MVVRGLDTKDAFVVKGKVPFDLSPSSSVTGSWMGLERMQSISSAISARSSNFLPREEHGAAEEVFGANREDAGRQQRLTMQSRTRREILPIYIARTGS